MNYEAVRKYFTTTNAPNGDVIDFVANYERSGIQRDRRGDAITDGFEAWGNDDFNIAVFDGGRLVSWDWMDEPIEDDEGVAEIGRGIGGDQ